MKAFLVGAALLVASVAPGTAECLSHPGSPKEGHWIYSKRIHAGQKCWFVHHHGDKDEVEAHIEALSQGDADDPPVVKPKRKLVLEPKIISDTRPVTDWLVDLPKEESKVAEPPAPPPPDTVGKRWIADQEDTGAYQLASLEIKPAVRNLTAPTKIDDSPIALVVLFALILGSIIGWIVHPREQKTKLKWTESQGYQWPMRSIPRSFAPSLSVCSPVSSEKSLAMMPGSIPEFLKRNPFAPNKNGPAGNVTAGPVSGRKRPVRTPSLFDIDEFMMQPV